MRSFLLLLCMAGGLMAAETPIRLADVRKIYIEKMNNNLDEYLRSSISKKFHQRIILVLERSQAEAILKGASTGAQHTENATVTLTDPQGRVVLWSGTAGDRDMAMFMKHGGEKKIADHLAADLKKAMEH